MLPGIDGYQVCREIRAKSDVPIIMLSAKGEVFDKVLGLNLAPTTIYSSLLTQRSLLQESRPCSDVSSLQSRRLYFRRYQVCGVSGAHCKSVQLLCHL